MRKRDMCGLIGYLQSSNTSLIVFATVTTTLGLEWAGLSADGGACANIPRRLAATLLSSIENIAMQGLVRNAADTAVQGYHLPLRVLHYNRQVQKWATVPPSSGSSPPRSPPNETCFSARYPLSVNKPWSKMSRLPSVRKGNTSCRAGRLLRALRRQRTGEGLKLT